MPTQTPASRKFRLPPSTAPTTTQKPPAFAASQFIRPSQTSSSPYARTPFSSAAQKQRNDEIVADDSSGENDDVDDAVSSRREGLSDRSGRISNRLIGEDDLVDDPRGPTAGIPTQQSQLVPSKNASVPSTKRRKLGHSLSEIIDDDLNFDLSDLPSSPIHSPIENQPETSRVHVPHSSPAKAGIQDNENDQPSSPTSSPPPSPPHKIQTPKHKHPKSRFRGTQPQSQSNPAISTTTSDHPYQTFPSFQSRLLASTSTNPHPNSTTNSPGPHIRNTHPNIDLTLPDAFSPSRKRGQRGYVYGGLAETVRGWVVDMATRVASGSGGTQTRAAVNADNENSGSTQVIPVSEIVVSDRSRRFVVVRSRDDSDGVDIGGEKSGKEQIWMLINTDPQARKSTTNTSRSDTTSSLSSVWPGQMVNIKGGESMSWNLNVDLPEKQAVSEGALNQCRVAVLWDVTNDAR